MLLNEALSQFITADEKLLHPMVSNRAIIYGLLYFWQMALTGIWLDPRSSWLTLSTKELRQGMTGDY